MGLLVLLAHVSEVGLQGAGSSDSGILGVSKNRGSSRSHLHLLAFVWILKMACIELASDSTGSSRKNRGV